MRAGASLGQLSWAAAKAHGGPAVGLGVGADEVDAYGRLSQNLLIHPPEVVGIGP